MTSKFYAVAKGVRTGIFEDWGEVVSLVSGFSGAIYKGFPTLGEAEEFLKAHTPVETKSLISTLTNEQKYVIQNLMEGHNIFLTGGGGCGKSYLISVIYNELPGLKRVGVKPIRIQLCALTGCAALLLGNKAKTLHSWAGIGLGKGTVTELHMKIKRNTKAVRNWLCTDLLIIDEISMMTAELLDKLNELAKKIRGNKKPFGGMQIMLVGDFYQLPPVVKGEEVVFAFEGAAWKEVIGKTIQLTQIQRQKDDTFQKILMEARVGKLSKESCQVLIGCQGREWRKNKIRPTLIFPRRAEVNMINNTNLKALEGRHYFYKANLVYDGKLPMGFTEKDEGFQRAVASFDNDASYDVELELALGAQVMLIANTHPELGLVNGSRGVIIDFCKTLELPIVEFMNGVKQTVGPHSWPIQEFEFVSRTQIPLRLAYANTTHKSQGSTLDSALIDIGQGIFEYGQAYVALSRVRSLDALFVHNFEPSAFKAHPKVRAFYDSLASVEIPEVHIVLPSEGKNTKQIMGEVSIPVRGVQVVKENAHPSAQGVNVSGAINKIKLSPCVGMNVNDSIGESSAETSALYELIPGVWKEHLHSVKPTIDSLEEKLNGKEYLPSKENIWKALELKPQDIKVVILGQDPYPTPGNAHGLSFSVQSDVKPIPASLKNIFKELSTDIGCSPPLNGNLQKWADQGVLLLNTVLTVEPGAPQSHSKMGWETVTNKIIETIVSECEGVVFVLWGKSAQVKRGLISAKHRVFESAHPSPLSASKGFFGSKPFSTINMWLKELGKEEIVWQL